MYIFMSTILPHGQYLPQKILPFGSKWIVDVSIWVRGSYTARAKLKFNKCDVIRTYQILMLSICNDWDVQQNVNFCNYISKFKIM